jgi:hypothetical protein
MTFWEKIKPAVPKRMLLLVAGCAWSIAGGILIARGLIQLIRFNHYLVLDVSVAILTGILFYLVLFARISSKHITRIALIPVDNPCFFSFFNFRSYLLMAVMIAGGITLRKLNLVPPEYLYTFFLAMGLPLMISSYRFFFSFYKNRQGI